MSTKNPKTSLQIVLVDDHIKTRAVLRDMLERQRGWKVAGEAGSGEDAVDLVRELKPDVVVMDVQMPGSNGIVAARKISQNQPEIPILMISNHVERPLVRAALDAGAAGYISKQHAYEELVPGICTICCGRRYLDSEILN